MNQNFNIDRQRVFLVALILVFGFLGTAQAGALFGERVIVDKEHTIFFPEKMGEALTAHKNFPVTWWNMLIFDMGGIEHGWEEARRVCEALKTSDAQFISRVECQQDLTQYAPLLADWAHDLPLRQDRPRDEDLLTAFDQALAKASLPLDRAVMLHLRNDPLESAQKLLALAGHRFQFNLEQKNGFLFHLASQHLLIPIQFNFPPDRDDLTSQFYEILNQSCPDEKNCARWVLVGSHASTWENKHQIMRDVTLVSQMGLTILLLFCLGLVLIRRLRLIFLIPPILFAIFIAIIVTVLVYGSIHGLVLSFGTGLVGISYDYGSHSALNPQVKSIWAANWFGYLTTVAVLGILMLSEIPLLQQLMFFSIIGLTLAFFILLLLHRFFPEHARARPLPLVPQVRHWKYAIVCLVWLGLFFSWKVDLKLGMSGFDFQSVPQRVASSWFFETIKTGIPLFEIHHQYPDDAQAGVPSAHPSLLEDLHKRLDWGRSHGIQVENAAVYLPPISQQTAHLETWKNSCMEPHLRNQMDDQQRIFFEPYLNTITCTEFTTNDLTQAPPPAYVADFNSDRLWMTLWLPKNQVEAEHIISVFPHTTSLKSLAKIFPTVLIKELTWMGPLSVVLVTLLLFGYFKKIKLTLIALIPFVTGLGLISWFHFISGLGFSFISLMALVMVYGMSVDFGIFATDTYRHAEKNAAQGVWTALFMAALTTIAGFIPLDFCQHQVLVDLGRTLTLGMIGTVLGTFWGVPFALTRIK